MMLAKVIDACAKQSLLKREAVSIRSFFKAYQFRYLRPYISLALTTSQRFDILRSYHGILHAACHKSQKVDGFEAKAVLWEKVAGGQKASVVIEQALACALEGDLTLSFVIDGLELYRVTVSIFNGSCLGLVPGRVVYVGGIQGLANARDQMRSAARSNGEIAPLDMLMIAVRALAQICNAGKLVGVKKADHVSQAYASEDLHFDYDTYWMSLGGIPTSFGYVLDTQPVEKPLAEIPTTHRSRTRRKRALKASIAEIMRLRASELFPLMSSQKPMPDAPVVRPVLAVSISPVATAGTGST